MNMLARRFTILTLLVVVFALGLAAAVDRHHRPNDPFGAALSIR